jgi:hypothetical protein
MSAAAELHRLREGLRGPITLGELVSRLGKEGVGLLAVLVSLPFLQPLPLAGLGTPVGLMLAAVGVQIARGHDAPALPRFVARHEMKKEAVDRLLAWAERLIVFIERFAHPRWIPVARSPRAFGAAIVALGLLFAIPVFVPLGNPLTAAALALLGIAMLEDDGLLGALGLAGTALTIAYHAAFFRLFWNGALALGARLP